MDKIFIRGGNPLSGSVKVHGAKNAVLPIIAATLLSSSGINKIHDVPELDDVFTISEAIKALNIDVTYQDECIGVDATRLSKYEAPYEFVRKMRASFLLMGPLLARLGRAKIPLPGGCAIGSRPVDQHLKGFEAMGAKIEIGKGYIDAYVIGKLRGAKIYLDVASVGATENIMMAATLATGTTVIENAAEEPEIVDLANFLNAMGAKVRGAGTGTIRIEGVGELQATNHCVIPDRIEAGTFMVAGAITRGEVFVEGAISDHLGSVIAKLKEVGVEIDSNEEGIYVCAKRSDLRAVDIKTLPYPGFPTDMQAQMMALMIFSKGNSIITESVFENRFMHVEEFRRMNAVIKLDGRSAIVEGNCRSCGAKVKATDLRAGAALALAALATEGETELSGLEHLDRGYVNFTGKLARLGADIRRVSSNGKEIVPSQIQSLDINASFA